MKRKIQSRIPISPEERDLVFEISAGIPQIIHLIGHMRMVCMDAKDISYLDILRWLNKNKLKGPVLLSWLAEKQDNSMLRAIAYIRMKAYSDFKVKPLIAIRPI